MDRQQCAKPPHVTYYQRDLCSLTAAPVPCPGVQIRSCFASVQFPAPYSLPAAPQSSSCPYPCPSGEGATQKDITIIQLGDLAFIPNKGCYVLKTTMDNFFILLHVGSCSLSSQTAHRENPQHDHGYHWWENIWPSG